jgi:hypothetical protein
MSDTATHREPVEIVEILVPKCVNVHGSAPCTATETGAAKCFNTRATCNDTDNFQARPLAHLTPDLTLEQGNTIDNASIDFADDALIEVDLWFDMAATGTIFAVGNASNFMYLGITSTDLVLAAGGTAGNQARATYAISNLYGNTVTLIARVDYSNDAVYLYKFCPVELELTLLASATASGSMPAAWAHGTDGTVGEDSGITYGSEDGGTFSSVITAARVHSAQTATLTPSADAYRFKYYFDDGRKAKPADNIYTLPMLTRASTVGTRLNLTGIDDRYEPLGRRAYADVTLADAPHSDYPFDPYRTDRGYDALKRSTFWAKWRIRHLYGKTRALVRFYHGYADEALADMTRQTYVLDSLNWGREAMRIRCRDYLSLTEFRRAQVPPLTDGELTADITAGATSFVLLGDVTANYPATGTVRINDELMTYGSRSYDSGADETTFSSVTRATDGTTADEHSAEDAVQICRRYTAARVDDVLADLIVNDAKVPAQAVDLASFTTEYEDTLSQYILTTIISEPTGVDRLIGEIAEQVGIFVWWDERAQKIKMQAITPVDTLDGALTQEANIVGDSFEIVERPKERITTISMFWNPRDWAGDLNKPSNFANQLLILNSSAQDLDQYGDLPQTREIYSRWLTTEGLMTQTGSRYSLRYADVPNYVRLKVDAKDRAYWIGNFVTISHDYLVDETGARDEARRFLIIECEENEPGHSQDMTLVDVTLDGRLYRITENGIGTYTPELFALANAFITDANGLNSDGTTGATIT